MDWYAQVVTTTEAAKSTVREQAKAGYDAIKVHNNLSPEVLGAIFEQARELRIDVVGHIPHQVSVAQALDLGYRTAEHFKGYLDDRALTIATDNWREASLGAELWNTPTLQAHRAHLRGAAASAVINNSESAMMSPLDLIEWQRAAAEPVDEVTRIRLAARSKADQIFRILLADGGRFLAGTDSGGGYPFMVYGRTLIRELEDFQSLGMDPSRVLRSATLEAALASRQEGQFGEIRTGAAADLLVLDTNPRTASSSRPSPARRPATPLVSMPWASATWIGTAPSIC